MKHKLHEYLKKAVIYEVNIRQYTEQGTIDAFRTHLPRLKKMGIDILWFMPIYPIGVKNRKGQLGSYYSISNFLEINPEFGSKEEFKNLVSEIHSLGMKVILDWVANHAAWDNIWTIDHPEYFERNENGKFISPFDWTDVIHIDHQNPNAHQAIQNAMCYWVSEFDIDGFRADLAHLTPLHFWIEARQKTGAIKPDLLWLAETEDLDYYETFDIIYSWKWMHATEDYFKRKISFYSLIDVLNQHRKISPDHTFQLFFTANHDENSWNGTEFEKYGHYVKALTLFNFLYPFSVPLIYSGQEIPNLKRLLFFEKDPIQWNHELPYESFYKKIIDIRKSIHKDDFLEFLDKGEGVLSFRRGRGSGSMIVMINLGNTEFVNSSNDLNGEFQEIINNSTSILHSNYGIRLKPSEYAVFRRC